MHQGDRITLTYLIEVDATGEVGLGAGLYDVVTGTDRSTGRFDIDSLPLESGTMTRTRLFIVPRVPRGRYELRGEVWPAGRIGAEDAETLAEASCPGYDEILVVPD
jgi:hypothetical protein